MLQPQLGPVPHRHGSATPPLGGEQRRVFDRVTMLFEEMLSLLHLSVAILPNQLTHLIEVNLTGSVDIDLRDELLQNLGVGQVPRDAAEQHSLNLTVLNSARATPN